jgi:hypothetical protein
MNEEETREMIEQAKRNIIKMVVGNNNSLCNELLNIFNSRIEIRLGSQSQNTNFAAYTSGSLIHKFDDKGNLLVQSGKVSIGIPYPPDSNSACFNGWYVDVHHELFHAFAKIMNGIKSCENNGNIYYSPIGGKISILKFDNNGALINCGDIPFSVLSNELTTDLFAYICTYKSLDGIFYGNDLDIIDERFGHYNGYYELLQLGLVIFNSFSNYTPNYDQLISNGDDIFNKKFQGNITCYYNDLMYGVLYNPAHIKDKFLEYASEKDWNELNKYSKSLLDNFQNNNRKIVKADVNNIMKIIKNYFVTKIEVMKTNKILSYDVINQLTIKFNERYEYAKTCYGIKETRLV